MKELETTTAVMKMAEAINDMKESTDNVLLVRGGQSAGKTYGMIQLAVDYLYDNPGESVIFIIFSYQQAKMTLCRDIIKVLDDFEIGYSANAYRTLFKLDNGSSISIGVPSSQDFFKGFHTSQYAMVIVDECNKIAEDQCIQLFARSQLAVGLYNPTPCEWIKSVPNSREIVLTYRDNEYIDPQERANIESYERLRIDENGQTVPKYERLYRIYNLGEFAESMLTCFTDVTYLRNFDDTFSPQMFGLDFSNSGGSNDGQFASGDPDALVGIQVIGNDIYAKAYFKTNQFSLDRLADELKRICGNKPIIADGANVRNIRFLQSRGVNVKPCSKKIQVSEQIRILNTYSTHVEASDRILCPEFKGYVWEDSSAEKIDKNGVHPDALDAFRYACQGIIRELSTRTSTSIVV